LSTAAAFGVAAADDDIRQFSPTPILLMKSFDSSGFRLLSFTV